MIILEKKSSSNESELKHKSDRKSVITLFNLDKDGLKREGKYLRQKSFLMRDFRRRFFLKSFNNFLV